MVAPAPSGIGACGVGIRARAVCLALPHETIADALRIVVASERLRIETRAAKAEQRQTQKAHAMLPTPNRNRRAVARFFRFAASPQ